jgi:hypothetical protein
MNKFSSVLIIGLVLFPLGAMSETYKCRSPNGKISYVNQMPMTPGIKCEQMFVRKQPVVVQAEQPAPPTESGDSPEDMDPTLKDKTKSKVDPGQDKASSK